VTSKTGTPENTKNIPVLETLYATLVAEAEDYRQLVAVTEREREALLGNNVTDLNTAIKAKQSLMSHLTRWAEKREQMTLAIAQELNLPANASLTDIIVHLGETIAQKLIAVREEFIDLMEQLITLNYANKLILQSELVRVDSTFDYIAAMAAEPNSNYSAPGANSFAANNASGNILNWQI